MNNTDNSCLLHAMRDLGKELGVQAVVGNFVLHLSRTSPGFPGLGLQGLGVEGLRLSWVLF